LFVSNAHNGTGLGPLSAFTESRAAVLSPIGSSPVADQQTAPCWVTISPDGRYLYVNESKIASVGAFAVSRGGNLTELPGSPTPLPAGATPAGIAVS
jgi:6-phosphogluconolactonase